MINEENTLNLDDRELEEDMTEIGRLAERGETEPLVSAFINILKKIDSGANKTEKQESVKEEGQD